MNICVSIIRKADTYIHTFLFQQVPCFSTSLRKPYTIRSPTAREIPPMKRAFQRLTWIRNFTIRLTNCSSVDLSISLTLKSVIQIKTDVVGDKRQQYAMSLVVLDNAVAELYQALEEANQLSNTYIIFASDNGACLYGGGKNAPLRGSKGTLFEGGTRVDAFIYSPLLPSKVVGSSYSGLMHVSDWFPTILDLAGVTSFEPKKGFEMDGVSQVQYYRTPSILRLNRLILRYSGRCRAGRKCYCQSAHQHGVQHIHQSEVRRV